MANINAGFMKAADAFEKQFEEMLKGVVKETVVGITETLVELSPVGRPDNVPLGRETWTNPVYRERVINEGYTPGQYISSWAVGINSIPALTSPTNSYDPTGASAINRATVVVNGMRLGDSISIINTAVNSLGEYYPAILELKDDSQYPGYTDRLNDHLPVGPYLTWDWWERNQDGVIAPTVLAIPDILESAVNRVK